MAELISPVAVFDCNVYAQALINSRGPAGVLVREVQYGHVRLVISDYVLAEIQALPRKVPARYNLTDRKVETFLVDLIASATKVASVPSAFDYPRDPADAAYVDLAVAGNAEYLVTRDRDLLALASNTPEGRDFKARFPAIRVLDPVSFLAELPHRELWE